MSSVLAPASLSLSTPMICSSVKRFRFMGLPPSAIQRWKIPVRNGPDIGGKVTLPLSQSAGQGWSAINGSPPSMDALGHFSGPLRGAMVYALQEGEGPGWGGRIRTYGTRY